MRKRSITDSAFRLMFALVFAYPGFSLAQPPSNKPFDKSKQTFTSFLSDYLKTHPFNGTILIQQNGIKLYQRSFGKANFQFGIANTDETKYKVASITKLFTSVLIMQLVENGKVELNKSIKTYLPNYKGEGGDKVTVFHLLTATSGIESNEKDVKGNDIPAMYAKPYSTDELLNLFCSGKLENEPGKVWNYNNADYVILGKIIEAVYGKSYEEVLTQSILIPLHMYNTGMFSMTKVIKKLANVYEVNDSTKSIENTPPIYTENYWAAGGLYSTAEDLLRFANALYGCKLLKQESVQMIIQPYLARYGLGLWVFERKVNNQTVLVAERQGAIRGTKTRLLHVPEKALTIILLSNAQTTSIDQLQGAILAALIR